MTRRTIIGIIFVLAALLKLAGMWNIIHLEWLWNQPWTEYIGPAILLFIGMHLIVYGLSHSHNLWLQRPVPLDENGKRICCSVRFGGDEYIYHGEPFKGARLDVFSGGIRLDLRSAVISEDEEIDIHTFLGGVKLLLPNSVNIITTSRSFIGGINNETTNRIIHDVPCIHIIASNILGGVKISN